jgi:hypothetical protein
MIKNLFFIIFVLIVFANFSLAENIVVIKYPEFNKLICENEAQSDLILYNNDNSDYKLFSVDIKGSNKEEFNSVIGNDELKVKDTLRIRFVFKPRFDGKKQAEVIIILKNILDNSLDKFNFILVAEKYSSKIEFSESLIEFGEVNLGIYEKSIKVYNVGSLPINFLKLPYIKGKFKLTGIKPIELMPGKAADLVIIFNADEYGSYNEYFILKDLCDNEYKIEVYGVVRKPKPTEKIILSVSNIESNTNDTVKLEIKIKNTYKLKEYGINIINTKLAFNSTILHPVNNTFSGIVRENLRIIPLILPISSDSIFYFDFLVSLGNDSVSILKLFDTQINDLEIDIVEQTGILRILNICNANGSRLIKIDEPIILNIKNINNSNLELEVNLIESGLTKIIIYDYNGNYLSDIVNNYLPKGLYFFYYNLNNLPPGNYYLKLETPTYSKVQRINVLR